VKTRERSQAISKTRDKISFLIQKQKAKILPKRLPLLFKEEQVSLDQKFKKTANEFYRTDREKTTKKVYEDEEVRWEGTRRIITLLR
jgi:hypothetical protein